MENMNLIMITIIITIINNNNNNNNDNNDNNNNNKTLIIMIVLMTVTTIIPGAVCNLIDLGTGSLNLSSHDVKYCNSVGFGLGADIAVGS